MVEAKYVPKNAEEKVLETTTKTTRKKIQFIYCIRFFLHLIYFNLYTKKKKRNVVTKKDVKMCHLNGKENIKM